MSPTPPPPTNTTTIYLSQTTTHFWPTETGEENDKRDSNTCVIINTYVQPSNDGTTTVVTSALQVITYWVCTGRNDCLSFFTMMTTTAAATSVVCDGKKSPIDAMMVLVHVFFRIQVFVQQTLRARRGPHHRIEFRIHILCGT